MKPKSGEIRAVNGGNGLMRVIRYDEKEDAVEMLGHGMRRGHWFHANRLSKEAYGREVVLKEREEARVRDVACNSPDCWCREFT